MEELNFDLGITAEQVAAQLRQSPVLSIVGYVGSGKSTLAEILSEALDRFSFRVFMQNASSWLRNQSRSFSRESQTLGRVDPEIVSAVKHLDTMDGSGCWIVDDAEIMLAYTTEELLRNLGQKLVDQDFALVLIRNRFILEEAGWLRSRQTLLSPEMRSLPMEPLEPGYAVAVATSMFQGPSREQQGQWLALMSGGVPGLMSELYRYTPTWPSEEPPPGLSRLIQEKRRSLELQRPLRQLVVVALNARALPPPALLSPEARSEMGALVLAGVVHPRYAMRDTPFQGDFWALVCEQQQTTLIPGRLIDIGLNLEIMIRGAALVDFFSQEFETGPDDQGVLAQAFAACLHCQERYPALAQPLATYLEENLGKVGLVHLLQGQGVTVDITAPTAVLIEAVFVWAGRP